MRMKLLLASSLLVFGLVAGGLIYGSKHSPYFGPRFGPPFCILVHIYGIEGNDEVTVTSIAEGSGFTAHATRWGNGDCGVSTGASNVDPPSGVWIVTAFAEGYTVEPDGYMVFLMDGMIVGPTQQPNFVFQRIS